MPKALKIIGLGCAVLLVFGAAGLFAWVASDLRPRPAYADLPPLARNMPGDWKQGEIEFHRRVLAQFPPGSSLAELLRALRAQGFYTRKNLGAFEQKAFPCNRTWVISWDAGTDGKIQSLRTNYNGACL